MSNTTRKKGRGNTTNATLIITILSGIIVLVILIIALLMITGKISLLKSGSTIADSSRTTADNSGAVSNSSVSSSISETEIETTTGTVFADEELIAKADRLAAMYDYDAAIELIKSVPGYENYDDANDLITRYELEKSRLVKWPDNKTIKHVFFHALIVDTDLCFKSDEASQYNQVMTTVEEFNKIMQILYDKGYVLVGVHDMAELVQQPDGTYLMVEKPIYLPEGKTPFVLSEDDVNYYEYMIGDGFASRLVVGEDGLVTTEMDLADGTSVIGSYDVVPIIEDFLKVHPDFSYRGAKGIIAVTGYNGVFGYRTSEYSYGSGDNVLYINPNIEEDRKKVTEVANALRATGWELASHSWGHRYLGSISMDHLYWDSNMWETEVETLIGDTDILLFPFGEDVGSWTGYTADNERYTFLDSLGFKYFCNVDSTEYWVQIRDHYFRQGRRNLDGTRMYQAILGKDLLSDLFDSSLVFDSARPVPVEGVVVE